MGSAAALIQIPPLSDRRPHLPNTEGSLDDFLFKIVSFLPVLLSFFSDFAVTQCEVAKVLC